MFVYPVVALVSLVVAVVVAWLLVVWQIVRRPILSVPIAVYVGLVAWVGAHDAQALAVYALIALAIWRLVHKRSFQRLGGLRLRSSWRRSWAYDSQWRDDRAAGSGEALPATPARSEDRTGRIRTVG